MTSAPSIGKGLVPDGNIGQLVRHGAGASSSTSQATQPGCIQQFVFIRFVYRSYTVHITT
jgi:hypothetical protein